MENLSRVLHKDIQSEIIHRLAYANERDREDLRFHITSHMVNKKVIKTCQLQQIVTERPFNLNWRKQITMSYTGLKLKKKKACLSSEVIDHDIVAIIHSTVMWITMDKTTFWQSSPPPRLLCSYIRRPHHVLQLTKWRITGPCQLWVIYFSLHYHS